MKADCALLYAKEVPASGMITPEEEEIRHLKALRIREGETVYVTNGRGTLYSCSASIWKKDVQLTVTKSDFIAPRKPSLTIAIAPTKNTDRLEWFVEKSVEIGIEQIYLIECENSERPRMKTERLERIAVSAMKQSEKCYLPMIHPLLTFSDWMSIQIQGQKMIAHCHPENKEPMKDVLKSGTNAVICIGPEGDFSPKEISLAQTREFIPVSLGNSRLRTETAGVVAVHTFELFHF
ncbi:MAG: 16S rRNA (uracil(1498)-N(3))-methyltransferase [Crocinitomicaceae bacterium]|nr:16S rRNA (uracil(1498)-N(3))-methyltransferase [Crocinitomicaceae bacterium]